MNAAHMPIEKHDGPAVSCRRCNPKLALEAQDAYVERWQNEHVLRLWGDVWLCPLCRQAVQLNPHQEILLAQLVEIHQEHHGADWLAYAHAGAETGEVSDDST